MPWTRQTQSKKHNRKAVGKKGKQWRAIANDVLRKTGDEGRAIRIASGVIKKRGKKRR